jgi:hypothetical protein
MGRTIVRVRPWGAGILGLEALVLGVVVGVSAHRAGMHGALATTIAIVAGAIFMALIVYVSWIFWLWTLLFAGGVGYNVYDAVLRGGHDRGWGAFWGVATTLIIIGLHVSSREWSQIDGDAVAED